MSARFWQFAAAFFFLSIGIGQIYLSLRLPGGLGLNIEEPGPGLFPALVGFLMCLAATIYLVQVFKSEAYSKKLRLKIPKDIILFILTIAGFIFLLTRTGFVIAAFILLFSSLSIYGMPKLWRRIVAAAIMTTIAYILFTLVLRVNLPGSTWFN